MLYIPHDVFEDTVGFVGVRHALDKYNRSRAGFEPVLV